MCHLLELESLSYFVHSKALVENISAGLRTGSLVALIGPNGSGKTTLLKLLAGVISPTAGEIAWKGSPLYQFSRLARSRILSLVPQSPLLQFQYSVKHFVSLGLYPLGISQGAGRVEKALDLVGALPLINREINELSSGERQRVYIARSLVTEAPILLLDEPTTHLDLYHRERIWNLLSELKSRGKLILVSNHDLLATQKNADHVIVLKEGACIANGPIEQAISPPLLEEVFGITLSAC